jgi:hypothetical protein
MSELKETHLTPSKNAVTKPVLYVPFPHSKTTYFLTVLGTEPVSGIYFACLRIKYHAFSAGVWT